MKLGLLGDIHGNVDALKAVLSGAERLGVSKLLITGDLIGYYFYPAEVLSCLESWDTLMVLGNHEGMLQRGRRDAAFLSSVDSKYGSGLRLALESLSGDQLAFLESLPLTARVDIDGQTILLCHGAPWHTDQYVYPDASSEIFERCASYAAHFVVMGHTHYPMDRRVGQSRLINPGSVGQPRNRQPGAAWAILDTEDGMVEMRIEDYDMSELLRECRLRHPDLPYLAEVLMRS